MDHYAAAAVVEALDLRNPVHIGHSTESGAVARYVAKHGPPCGAVLMSAVTLKAGTNLEGTPMVCSTVSIRPWPRTAPSSSAMCWPLLWLNWGRDFYRSDPCPPLVLHGEDDPVVPTQAARRAITLRPNGPLKTCPGFFHRMLTVNADVLNKDLLDLVKR